MNKKLFWVVVLFAVCSLIGTPKTIIAPTTYQLTEGYAVNQNALLAVSVPPQKFEVLGSLGDTWQDVLEEVYFSGIIKCLAKEESTLNPDAYNSDDPNGGSFGLLQFQTKTFQKYCVEKYGLENDIWSAEIQIRCADKMLTEDLKNLWQWSTANLCLKK